MVKNGDYVDPNLTPEQQKKLLECYMRLTKQTNETIHDYYGNDILTLAQLNQLLGPLCSTHLKNHADNMYFLPKKERKRAYLQAMEYLIGLLQTLADRTDEIDLELEQERKEKK